jgi:hypothetical protein
MTNGNAIKNIFKTEIMKSKTIDQAKDFAKEQSLKPKYMDTPVYIIHCNRTASFYVETNSIIRNWEQLIGYYINGNFTAVRYTP